MCTHSLVRILELRMCAFQNIFSQGWVRAPTSWASRGSFEHAITVFCGIRIINFNLFYCVYFIYFAICTVVPVFARFPLCKKFPRLRKWYYLPYTVIQQFHILTSCMWMPFAPVLMYSNILAGREISSETNIWTINYRHKEINTILTFVLISRKHLVSLLFPKTSNRKYMGKSIFSSFRFEYFHGIVWWMEK